MVRVLRDGGMLVESHGAHFKPTASDAEWLGELNAKGWVGLSKDKAISFSPLAVATIMTSGAKLFICVGKATHYRLARNILHSRHKLDQFVRKHNQPFIARLYMAPDHKYEREKAGEIKMWKTRTEWLEEQRSR